MSGVKYLLDTNIIIGLLNRHASALSLVAQYRFSWDECAISAITRMELLSYHSMTPQELTAIQQMLNRLSYLPIDAKVEAKTIEFRRAHRGKLPDAIVAATALSHQLKLLTLDSNLAGKML